MLVFGINIRSHHRDFLIAALDKGVTVSFETYTLLFTAMCITEAKEVSDHVEITNQMVTAVGVRLAEERRVSRDKSRTVRRQTAQARRSVARSLGLVSNGRGGWE